MDCRGSSPARGATCPPPMATPGRFEIDLDQREAGEFGVKISDAGARKLAARLGLPVRQIFKTPVRQKAAGGLIGYVDQIGPSFVRGWAADRDNPGTSLSLRIYLDGDLVALGVADLPRDDLRAAGYGEGRHAFHLPAPTKALFCGEVLTVTAVASDGGEKLVVRHPLREPEARTTPIIYLDASDLFEYLTHHRELSGIQRVQAGYLLNLGDTTIGKTVCRICARFPFSNFYWTIPVDRFTEFMSSAGNAAVVSDADRPRYVHAFKESLTSRSSMKAGDTLFTMGAPWALDHHNDLIRCLKYQYGANYLQVFYDFIPISTPEVVASELIPAFARSMAAMSIYATHVFSISRYSMEDLGTALYKLGRQAPEGSVIPMGGTITDVDEDRTPDALKNLDIDGPFVLSVGTLEPRKNHMLLFQVWRRLVAKHGAANVPKLVLVGRFGWYMEHFIRMLKATDFVEQTIVRFEGVSNAELSELYDACLFTMFPSISEGWGLPITESLARGKVCVCSNVTSMPEAGGEHAIYIDPYDTSSAVDVCEALIFDGTTLAEREAHLRATFKPVTWADASNGLRRQLEGLVSRLGTEIPQREPIELGRLYHFHSTWAAGSDALAMKVFEHFLDQEDATAILTGWNWFEIDVNCTWACGPTAQLCLVPPAESPGDLVAYIEIVTPPAFMGVRCTLAVDGVAAGRFSGGDLRLMVPLSNVRAGQPVILTFTYDDLGKPVGLDPRYLGIGIRTLAVFARDDLAGRLNLWEEDGVKRIGS